MDTSTELLLRRLVKEFDNVNSQFPLSPGKVVELTEIIDRAKQLLRLNEKGLI